MKTASWSTLAVGQSFGSYCVLYCPDRIAQDLLVDEVSTLVNSGEAEETGAGHPEPRIGRAYRLHVGE